MIPLWALSILKVAPPRDTLPLCDYLTYQGCRTTVFRSVTYVDAFEMSFLCDHILLSGGNT